MSFYFYNTGASDAFFNMALDEVLIGEVEKNPSLTFLRVYAWKPWAISIGYSQNPSKDFNLEKIKTSNVQLVRRLTGGRAVFHANELTYSFISSLGNPLLKNGLHETYNVIGKAILTSLHKLGFSELSLEKSLKKEKGQRMDIARPCFSSTARYEIVWKGKKVVGSAQRRMKKAVQQHGSVLLDSSYLGIVDYLKLDEKSRDIYLDELKENAVSLLDVAGKEVEYKKIAATFSAGFEEVFKEEIKPFTSNAEILKRAEKLAKEKYSSDNWNFKI